VTLEDADFRFNHCLFNMSALTLQLPPALKLTDEPRACHQLSQIMAWLNQIEIWFSILVPKLLRRASFTSIAELKARILEFIDYFNRTMAKPFKWTYKGKALAA
jgi:hypothetical protein